MEVTKKKEAKKKKKKKKKNTVMELERRRGKMTKMGLMS